MTPETLWRICRAPFADLDGEGARLFGGRWNPTGTPMVYTSTSLALAALEVLVHTDPDAVPGDLLALRIDTGGLAVETHDDGSLPPGWRAEAAGSLPQRFGETWVREARSALLLLPSALLPAAAAPAEASVLVNPRHPDAPRLRVVERLPFSFDNRLLSP